MLIMLWSSKAINNVAKQQSKTKLNTWEAETGALSKLIWTETYLNKQTPRTQSNEAFQKFKGKAIALTDKKATLVAKPIQRP